MTAQTTKPAEQQPANGVPPPEAPPVEAAAHAKPKRDALATVPQSPEEAAWALVQRKALAYSDSVLVPPAYQKAKGIPNVIIALDLAERIRCSPLMLMQNLDIIEGVPGLRAKFLIATVNTCGRFSPLRYEWEGKQGEDSWGCRAVATDLRSKEKLVGPLVSIAIAKAEGWYDRKGSKWKTTPELMLMYRSATFWTRVFASELSLGMQTAEEVHDIQVTAVPIDLAPGDTSVLEAELLDDAKPTTSDGAKYDATTGEIEEPKL